MLTINADVQTTINANVRTLVNILNNATQSYNLGSPQMTDKEWDDLYFSLQKLEQKTHIIYPDSPTQTINYTVVNSLSKVEHNHKMLSLDKTKDIDAVMAVMGKEPYIAMFKMDGLTCSLRYLDGKLVSAETRGNGYVGEDITHNARVIASIPQTINNTNEVIVDGEIICNYNDFEEFSKIYKNPRNFAAGSIRLLDSQECAKRKLTFVAWDLIKGSSSDLMSERLDTLDSMGFETVCYWKSTDNNIDVEAIKRVANYLSYPIDGIVFKFNSISYGLSLGETGHHFKNAIAFKFYDEKYWSVLRHIDWTMGRTGILTPVAVFDPIDIDGSNVERASLHNISIMEALYKECWHDGLNVEIYKANEIIPQISAVSESDIPYNYQLSWPETCPICGGKTAIQVSDAGVKELVCTNPACSGKLINKIDHFCGKKGLEIKGLSIATIEKLIKWNWLSDLTNLFQLAQHRDEWIKKPNFGIKSVDNILNAIETAREVTLDKFIAAIGIPLIGTTIGKEIAKREETWESFREDIRQHFNFSKWDGFGPEMTEALWQFDYTIADILAHNYLHITNPCWVDPVAKDTSEIQKLKDITIVITGKLNHYKNRAEFQTEVENNGGKVVTAVSRNVNCLINNNRHSASAKNTAAQQLGIPILSEDEFIEKFLKKS